ncbi:Asp23/Gls24 family envelope stress response protein [Dialister invisus]|uniref:Asp23/Gls24 family envelope stress response protein n=1 Tax=Dialister invisus TaxID=218538 RepID=UPI003A8EBEBC
MDLYICVKHGMRIPAVALQLQEAVKEDIFQYTGITVAEVNVNVQQIVFSAAR